MKYSDLESTLRDFMNLFVSKGNSYTTCTLAHLPKDRISTVDFDYFISSRTIYENIQINQALGTAVNGKVPRKFSVEKYFLIDTVFPLYKSLKYTDNPEGIGDNSNKIHMEINYIYEVPKIIYTSVGKLFDEEVFISKYTSVEYYILIDLFTSLILGIISKEEEQRLLELMNKDEVLRAFYQSMLRYTGDKSVYVETKYSNGDKIGNIINPNGIFDIIREYLCQLMVPIFETVSKEVKSSNEITLKSINDFRFICTVQKRYNPRFDVYISTDKIPSIKLSPRIFKGYESINHLCLLTQQGGI